MRRPANTLVVVSVLGSLAFRSGASAQNGSEVDLTGTWEGTVVCDELLGGGYVNFIDTDDFLEIIQDGNTFRIAYRSVGEGDEVADDLLYEGVIQEVEGSIYSEAMAGTCGGDYEAQEIIRLRRILASGEGGRFDAESIFFTDDFPGAEGVFDFLSCKYAYEQVSTELPEVPECARPGGRDGLPGAPGERGRDGAPGEGADGAPGEGADGAPGEPGADGGANLP
jgi:hypothetical protein